MGQWTKITSSEPSKWIGKKWNVIGDSITEVNFRTTMHYHDYIKNDWGMTVNNYGISGTGYFCGSTPFPNRISSIDSTADLITIFGGTNDWANVSKTLVLGAYGDTDKNASFYGAIDSTLTQLINMFPTKTIAVFTPTPRSDGYGDLTNPTTGYTMKQIVDAIIQGCNKYTIPVFDLYRNSGLFPWNTTSNNTYFNPNDGVHPADGLHLNDAGHKVLADKIKAFLNTL